MAIVTSTSRAAANAVSVVNEQFKPAVTNVEHKVVIVANYDETTKTTIVENTLYQMLSEAQAGDTFGFGFAMHRLVKKVRRGGWTGEIWAVPVDWDAAPVASTRDITFVATATSAGILYLRIAGEEVFVNIAKGLDETGVADAAVLVINADEDLPVTAANALGVMTLTSKDKNASANDISAVINYGDDESLPVGLTSATVAAASGGAGIMNQDMKTALEEALGLGDAANTKQFTDLVQGFGDDATVLDDVSEYNGEGNLAQGCWSDLVHKPLRSMTGDVVAGSTGFTAAKALGTTRRELDRTNGQISVPGSPSHPNEIAALFTGVAAATHHEIPARPLTDMTLPDVLPGALADDWCSQAYSNRDQAVKSGNSPTLNVGGVVKIQNVQSFYHPVGVQFDSNGYRSWTSISKSQNLLASWWANFQREFWQGQIVVSDIAKVSNPTVKRVAKDRISVLTDAVELLTLWEKEGWIFQAQWSIDKLTNEIDTRIVLRAGASGWDVIVPVVYSGEADVKTGVIQFDTSTAVITG